MKVRSLLVWWSACLLAVSCVRAEVVFKPLDSQARRGPNLVANPGFEQAADGKPVGWTNELDADWALDRSRLVLPDTESRP